MTEADWYINIDHLMGKVRKKMSILYPKHILCNVLKELCVICIYCRCDLVHPEVY